MLFQNLLLLTDYGPLGYVLIWMPAIFILLAIIITYLLMGLLLRKSSIELQAKIYLGVSITLILIAILGCWQGSYGETAYTCIPSGLGALLFLQKTRKLSVFRKLTTLLFAMTMVTLLIGIITLIF